MKLIVHVSIGGQKKKRERRRKHSDYRKRIQEKDVSAYTAAIKQQNHAHTQTEKKKKNTYTNVVVLFYPQNGNTQLTLCIVDSG